MVEIVIDFFELFSDSSLFDVLQKMGPWAFRFFDASELGGWMEEDSDFVQEGVFFLAAGLDLKVLTRLLLNGAKIILNAPSLNPDQEKKLHRFCAENGLQWKSLKNGLQWDFLEVRTGLLLMTDIGAGFSGLNHKEKVETWENILKSLDISLPEVKVSKGIQGFWSRRLPRGGELDYEEIRRLSLYNFSSYKKSPELCLPKTYSLLRVLDCQHCEVVSKGQQISLVMLPKAQVSLDVGRYSE